MTRLKLTAREQRVLEFIRGYISSNNESPTIAEIGRHFQLRSSASVHQIIIALEKKGAINKKPNVSRGITIVTDSDVTEEIVKVGPETVSLDHLTPRQKEQAARAFARLDRHRNSSM
ncbi:MAG: repressor LexA [Acidobacteriota bacterium]|jgi:SOS-response transcriptional repressor LexA